VLAVLVVELETEVLVVIVLTSDPVVELLMLEVMLLSTELDVLLVLVSSSPSSLLDELLPDELLSPVDGGFSLV